MCICSRQHYAANCDVDEMKDESLTVLVSQIITCSHLLSTDQTLNWRPHNTHAPSYSAPIALDTVHIMQVLNTQIKLEDLTKLGLLNYKNI